MFRTSTRGQHMPHTILVDVVNAAAYLEPIDRLNGEFNTYLATTKAAGFRFTPVGDRKGQAGAVDDLPTAVAPKNDIDDRLARGKFEPYPYQRIGAKWLSERRSGLLFDEMGLGKTNQ